MTVARVLRAFGHDVLAAGRAGGATGELIIQDLAKSGVPTAFTLIRGESRRFFGFAGPEPGGPVLRFSEPGPYITTEELGRFAADYRRLLDAVRVEPSARGYLKELVSQDGVLRLSCSA